METCDQTKGQSVYQHGVSVNLHVNQLISGDTSDWKLPDWFDRYKSDLLKNTHSREIIDDYTIFHDCGKPFCKTIDEDGKTHFKNHAEVSKKTFLEYDGNHVVAKLIGDDMVIHTDTADQIQSKIENDWTIQDACTLLIVALSEIHSNAKLFGGIDSISFKQKFKKIEQRGKQICKFYLERNSNERLAQ